MTLQTESSPSIAPDPPAAGNAVAWPEAASLGVLLLVAVLATLPGWLPGRVMVPTDHLAAFAVWSDPAHLDARPIDPIALEQLTRTIPWTTFAARCLKGLDVPLWNPHAGLGRPFLASNQVGVFYPTILLHMYLGPGWAWTIAAALKLFVAGTGAWLLAGRYGLRRGPRLLSGLAFMLCGFNVAYLNGPQTNVAACLPWAILVLDRLIDRPRLGWISATALVIALQSFGGSAETSLHLLAACGAFVLLSLAWAKPMATLKALPAIVLATVLCLMIGGIQWLPWIDYAWHSAIAAAKPVTRVGPVLKPNLTGLLAVLFPHEFSLRIAAGGWVGVIPLLLALLGVARGCRRKAVVLWTVLGLAALLGTIAMAWLPRVHFFTGLDPAHGPRLLVVTALSLSILAGFGLDWLLGAMNADRDLRGLGRALRWIAIVLAGGSVVAALTLVLARKPLLAKAAAWARDATLATPTAQIVYRQWLWAAGWLLLIAGLLAGAALLLSAWGRRKRLACSPLAWITLAAVQLLAFAIATNPGAAASSYFPDAPAIAFLKAQRDADGAEPFRIAALGDSFPAEAATFYRLRDLRASDGLGSMRFWQWMQQQDDRAQSLPGDIAQLARPDSPVLCMAGVRFLLVPADRPAPPAPWKRAFPSEGQASPCAVYEQPSVAPGMWQVSSAEPREAWAPTAAAAAERARRAATQPAYAVAEQRVALDADVPADVLDWLDRLQRAPSAPPEAGAGRPRRQLPGGAAGGGPELRVVERSSSSVKLRLTDVRKPWLVFDEAYTDGWIARNVTKPRVLTGGARPAPPSRMTESDYVVLPAHGALRAINLASLPPGENEVIVSYAPAWYRRGILATATGLIVLALLLGMSLFRM